MSRQVGYGEPLTAEDAAYLRDHNDPRGFVEIEQAEEPEVETEQDDEGHEPEESAEESEAEKPKATRRK